MTRKLLPLLASMLGIAGIVYVHHTTNMANCSDPTRYPAALKQDAPPPIDIQAKLNAIRAELADLTSDSSRLRNTYNLLHGKTRGDESLHTLQGIQARFRTFFQSADGVLNATRLSREDLNLNALKERLSQLFELRNRALAVRTDLEVDPGKAILKSRLPKNSGGANLSPKETIRWLRLVESGCDLAIAQLMNQTAPLLAKRAVKTADYRTRIKAPETESASQPKRSSGRPTRPARPTGI